MTATLYGAFIGLILLAVIAAVYFIMLWVLAPEKNYLLVVPVTSGMGELVEKLYAARMRANLLGDGRRCAVVAADLGLTKEERRFVEELCRETPGLAICDPDDLFFVLEQKSR